MPEISESSAPLVELSVPDPSATSVDIYLNPAKTLAQLRYFFALGGEVTINIYNLLGDQVGSLSRSDKLPGSHSTMIELSEFPGSIYLIKLAVDGNTLGSSRLIVDR